jgi:hypothetical protein
LNWDVAFHEINQGIYYSSMVGCLDSLGTFDPD